MDLQDVAVGYLAGDVEHEPGEEVPDDGLAAVLHQLEYPAHGLDDRHGALLAEILLHYLEDGGVGVLAGRGQRPVGEQELGGEVGVGHAVLRGVNRVQEPDCARKR